MPSRSRERDSFYLLLRRLSTFTIAFYHLLISIDFCFLSSRQGVQKVTVQFHCFYGFYYLFLSNATYSTGQYISRTFIPSQFTSDNVNTWPFTQCQGCLFSPCHQGGSSHCQLKVQRQNPIFLPTSLEHSWYQLSQGEVSQEADPELEIRTCFIY